MAKKQYADLDDLTKIKKQWHKMSGLHSREDWSAAMVRAATAAEIAANYAVRREFAARSKFNGEFVDKLLRWANGIDGKVTRLIVPLHSGRKHEKAVAALKGLIEDLNKKRNEIVHSGHFMNKKEAKETISRAKVFIETVVGLYQKGFELTDPDA
ncbi:MAG TPA: hypothetical protein VGG10_16435 [Rhizomicrobium sp.]|jgi:hypothetical protein